GVGGRLVIEPPKVASAGESGSAACPGVRHPRLEGTAVLFGRRERLRSSSGRVFGTTPVWLRSLHHGASGSAAGGIVHASRGRSEDTGRENPGDGLRGCDDGFHVERVRPQGLAARPRRLA